LDDVGVSPEVKSGAVADAMLLDSRNKAIVKKVSIEKRPSRLKFIRFFEETGVSFFVRRNEPPNQKPAPRW
jgi:hypothetical protein